MARKQRPTKRLQFSLDGLQKLAEVTADEKIRFACLVAIAQVEREEPITAGLDNTRLKRSYKNLVERKKEYDAERKQSGKPRVYRKKSARWKRPDVDKPKSDLVPQFTIKEVVPDVPASQPNIATHNLTPGTNLEDLLYPKDIGWSPAIEEWK